MINSQIPFIQNSKSNSLSLLLNKESQSKKENLNQINIESKKTMKFSQKLIPLTINVSNTRRINGHKVKNNNLDINSEYVLSDNNSSKIIIPYIKRNSRHEISSKYKTKHLTQLTYKGKENEKNLLNYGSSIFLFIQSIEKRFIFDSLLSKHSVSSEIRTKMIDWILEVFSVFKFDYSCFFLTVHIIDSYIQFTDKLLTDDDIHLLGMVAMFIASKIEESKGLSLDFLYEKVGYCTFPKEQIIKHELEIIKTIKPENLIFTSSAEFIKSFCYDFTYNNRSFLEKYNISKIFEILEFNAVYYSMLISHFDTFCKYPSSLKGIACLVLSFENLKFDVSLKKDEEFYIKEWIRYIVKESKVDNLLQEIYTKSYDAIDIYSELEYIGFNLNVNYQKKKEDVIKGMQN